MKIMPSMLLVGVAAAAILSLAVGAEMKHTPPANVNLAGLWRINPDLSDDPRRAVEKRRSDNVGGGPTGGGPARSRGGTQVGGIVIDAGDILGGVLGGTSGSSGSAGRGSNDRPADDPEPVSMRVPLDAFLATLDQFEIQQARDSLTIATVEEQNTCKPADPGKALVPGGELGERRCGWQGDTWVTEVTSPKGVTRTNRYELKNGGRQLVMTSEIKGGKTEPLAGLRIKRIYDRVL
jgi:hypothetical protein